MKTKILSPLRRDGYKAGMIMMLIALSTMLLTTACNSEDDLVNNTANTENTINKGYALPVTVNVTRQGDEGTTRATYNESTRKLSFSEGDKLFVEGLDNGGAGDFAGTLDYDAVSGKFSGTIYTESPYEGTAAALFTAASSENNVEATLLPASYKDHGYLVINTNVIDAQYDDFIEESNEYTLATSKADGVAQFSYEKSYSYNEGFALAPQNAILNFTITGLAASTSVNVSLTSMTYNITGTVTTDGSGNATFSAGVSGGKDLNDFSLTVDGNNIAMPTKTTEAGHIYNISRNVYPVALSAVTADYLGSVVTTDGNVYATVDDATDASKTAAAVIAYVSSTGHGLAIALSDESSKANMGTLLPKINNMTHTPAVSGQTWKLPKEDEWKQMFSANGGSNSSYSGLNTAITNAGGSALQASDYWVAHNTSTSNMTKMTLSGGNATFGSGGAFNSYYVRVGFAF